MDDTVFVMVALLLPCKLVQVKFPINLTWKKMYGLSLLSYKTVITVGINRDSQVSKSLVILDSYTSSLEDSIVSSVTSVVTRPVVHKM